MSTEQGGTVGTPTPSPRRQPAQRPTLPDWMRDPPPPRLTLGDRITGALLRVPGAAAVRRYWWAWRDRQRLYQRFPTTFKIVAFFASWAIALVLLLVSYALFSLV